MEIPEFILSLLDVEYERENSDPFMKEFTRNYFLSGWEFYEYN